jgi:hypothetical protein
MNALLLPLPCSLGLKFMIGKINYQPSKGDATHEDSVRTGSGFNLRGSAFFGLRVLEKVQGTGDRSCRNPQ